MMGMQQRFAVLQSNLGVLEPRLIELKNSASLSPEEKDRCDVLLTAMRSPPIPGELQKIDMTNLRPFFAGVYDINKSVDVVAVGLQKQANDIAPTLLKLLDSNEGGLPPKQTVKCRELLTIIQQPLLKELSSYIDEYKRSGPSFVDSWKKSGSQYSDKLGAALQLQQILMSVGANNNITLTGAQLTALFEPKSKLALITEKAMIFLPESVRQQLENSLYSGKKPGTP
jgi:hypothetical protein